MVMDAKLETLGLIRTKLKDENAALKTDLEKSHSQVLELSQGPSAEQVIYS